MLLNTSGKHHRLRARDIVSILKGKVDPSLVDVLTKLSEQQMNMEHQMGELARLVQELIDSQVLLTQSAESVTQRLNSAMKESDEELAAAYDMKEED